MWWCGGKCSLMAELRGVRAVTVGDACDWRQLVAGQPLLSCFIILGVQILVL